MAQWQQWTWFGSAAGIEIVGDQLRVAAVRLRPQGVTVLGTEMIERFQDRPASGWGMEVASFLRRYGLDGRPLMVVLPASEAISRTVLLPGVSKADLAAAVDFQLDGLHPYGDGAAATAWAPLARPGSVLAAAARREVLESYRALFAEAGVLLAGFTTPAAAIQAARRYTPPVAELLAVAEREGEIWLYGESAAMPLFWGVTDAPRERAETLARAQLRLSAVDVTPLADVLPGGEIAAAAALMAARPGGTLNLLPEADRAVLSRWRAVPAAVLSVVALALAGALAAFPQIEEQRLVAALNSETARWETPARRARQLEAERQAALQRVNQMRQFRQRTKQDLDALLEATRLIAPPAWAGRLDLTRTTLAVAGEAGQATELLQLFDQSPLFQNSEFVAPLARSRESQLDNFQLRAQREGR